MSQLEKTENRLATLKMSLLKNFHSEVWTLIGLPKEVNVRLYHAYGVYFK